MPTILRWQGYRFYFYSHETNEPPHVHIDHAGATCKFWLHGATLAYNRGYSDRELTRLRVKVIEERERFGVAWRDFFGEAR
jgi:hypothetical protein